MGSSSELVIQHIALVIEGGESQLVARNAKQFVSSTSNQIHGRTGQAFVEQDISVGRVTQAASDNTLLDAFSSLLLFVSHLQRVHLGAQTNKLLDRDTGSFVLHLAKDLEDKKNT